MLRQAQQPQAQQPLQLKKNTELMKIDFRTFDKLVVEPVETTVFVSLFLWSFQYFDASTGSVTTGSTTAFIENLSQT